MWGEERAKEEFSIREFRGEGDAEAGAKILREAHGAAKWSAEGLRQFAEEAGARSYVGKVQGMVKGIVVGRRVGDEGELLNLAVREDARRRGMGRALVERLLAELWELGASRVFLEVRESNAEAIAFYGKLGFQGVGKRKDYYEEPREGAVVMELLRGGRGN